MHKNKEFWERISNELFEQSKNEQKGGRTLLCDVELIYSQVPRTFLNHFDPLSPIKALLLILLYGKWDNYSGKNLTYQLPHWVKTP